MKTNSSMKFLTIIFCFCATTVMAQHYNGIYTTTGEYSSPVGGAMYGGGTQITSNEVCSRYEEIHFGSTSMMLTERGEEPAGLVEISGNQYPQDRRRVSNKQNVGPDTPPADPFDEPLGDTPWFMMLLLALGYALRIARKKYGNRLPAAKR